jgi:hypothetical protein
MNDMQFKQKGYSESTGDKLRRLGIVLLEGQYRIHLLKDGRIKVFCQGDVLYSKVFTPEYLRAEEQNLQSFGFQKQG